jgi:phosphoglycerate kinase
MLRSIKEAPELKGKKVLLRVDWSAPMKDGVIQDDYQIKVSLPTLSFLVEAGAEVVVATHLESLEDSIEPLKVYLPEGVKLLPNLRENPGEEANSEEWARELASMADLYVNEAFAVSHREHASIVGVPKFIPSFAGFQLLQEVENLSKAFNPPHPFLIILGGAKIETKLPLIEKFSKIADTIFIGGGLAVRANELELQEKFGVLFPSGELSAPDANEKTLQILKSKIAEARLIVWNGPLGKYETGYTKYTNELAVALAQAEAEVMIGGGDTLVSIRELGLLSSFSFVSTGGGAMLNFLAYGTLPGLEVLK